MTLESQLPTFGAGHFEQLPSDGQAIQRRLLGKNITLLSHDDISQTTDRVAQLYLQPSKEAHSPAVHQFLPVRASDDKRSFYFAKIDHLAKAFGLEHSDLQALHQLGDNASKLKALESLVLRKELMQAIDKNDRVASKRLLQEALASGVDVGTLRQTLPGIKTQFYETILADMRHDKEAIVEYITDDKQRDLIHLANRIRKEDPLYFARLARECVKNVQLTQNSAMESLIKLSTAPRLSLAILEENVSIKNLVGDATDRAGIRNALEEGISLCSKDTLAEQKLKSALAHFDAIYAALDALPGGSHNLKPYEVLQLAIFALKKIGKSPDEFGMYSPWESHLERDCVLDSYKKAIYIFSKLGHLGEVENPVEQALKFSFEGTAVSPQVRIDLYKAKTLHIVDERKVDFMIEAETAFAHKEIVPTDLTIYPPASPSRQQTSQVLSKPLHVECIISPRYDFNLASVLDDPNKMTRDQKIKCCIELAVDLANMHDKGFVHRDIRADNATVTNGVARWDDFEETRAVGQFPEGESAFYPSRQYTAPEVLQDRELKNSAEQDKAQEAFAFGCMLYELFVHPEIPWKVPPKIGPEFVSDCIQEQEAAYLRVRRYADENPANIAIRLCERLLTPEPSVRYTLSQIVHEAARSSPALKEIIVTRMQTLAWHDSCSKAFATALDQKDFSRLDALFDLDPPAGTSLSGLLSERLAELPPLALRGIHQAYKEHVRVELKSAGSTDQVVSIFIKALLVFPDASFSDGVVPPALKEQVVRELKQMLVNEMSRDPQSSQSVTLDHVLAKLG